MGVLLILCYFICYFYFISSPFPFVIDDDHVIRYTGEDESTGDVVDA